MESMKQMRKKKRGRKRIVQDNIKERKKTWLIQREVLAHILTTKEKKNVIVYHEKD